MSTPKMVTLENLADGAAEELFREALGGVLANIDDPNTAWKPKRRITLTVDFVVREDRKGGEVVLSCVTKLAPVKPIAAAIHLGRHEGQLAIVEALKQEDMFTEPAGRPQAVDGARA